MLTENVLHLYNYLKKPLNKYFMFQLDLMRKLFYKMAISYEFVQPFLYRNNVNLNINFIRKSTELASNLPKCKMVTDCHEIVLKCPTEIFFSLIFTQICWICVIAINAQ